MTNALRDLAIAATASLPASILIKVTIALGLAFAAVRLARRSRAAVRHVVLLAAFVVMLGLPLMAAFAPAMPIGLRVAQPAVAMPDVAPADVNDVPSVPTAPGAAVLAVPHTAGSSWLPSTGSLLFGLWAVGAGIALVPVLLGLWQVRSLRRTASPWPAGAALIGRVENPRGDVDVLLHERVAGPVACGARRHTILLPRDADLWPAEDLRRALVHELAHIRRGDWISQCAARALCAAYWFHPLAWAAWRRLTVEAERACDDAVLQQAEPTAYAHQLVSLAKRLSTPNPAHVLAMANRHDLAMRVSAVLDRRQPRGAAGPRVVALAVVAVALIVTALGPARLVASSAATTVEDQNAGAGGPRFEVASIKPNHSGEDRSPSMIFPGGRFSATNNSLRDLILNAYGILATPYLLQGAPGWIESARYDVEAKAPAGAIADGVPARALWDTTRAMLRTLLTERFGLSIRRETREGPIYRLVSAASGPKLQRSKLDCTGDAAACHGFSGNPRRLSGSGVDTYDLAMFLSRYTDRPIVDATGIQGVFDVALQWNPFADRPEGAETSDAPASPSSEGPLPDSNTLPTLAAALQERLGLKLEATRGPIDTYVIERIDQLVPNDSSAGPAKSFDVASIKPCQPSSSGTGRSGGAGMTTSPGRLNVQCMTIAEMIARAYIQYGDPRPANAPGFVDPSAIKSLVTDGPAWIYSDPFTIEATTSGTALPTELVGGLLRELLESRLHLKLHQDQRRAAAYALTVAPGGLKAERADPASCTPPDPQGLGRARLQEPGAKPLCANGFGWHGPNLTWKATGVTMDQIARSLWGIVLHREVIDRTGVTGQFTFAIEFARDDSTAIRALPSDVNLPDASADVPPGPSIFTALERQVGLKLNATQGAEGFLVVDHVERPADQ